MDFTKLQKVKTLLASIASTGEAAPDMSLKREDAFNPSVKSQTNFENYIILQLHGMGLKGTDVGADFPNFDQKVRELLGQGQSQGDDKKQTIPGVKENVYEFLGSLATIVNTIKGETQDDKKDYKGLFVAIKGMSSDVNQNLINLSKPVSVGEDNKGFVIYLNNFKRILDAKITEVTDTTITKFSQYLDNLVDNVKV